MVAINTNKPADIYSVGVKPEEIVKPKSAQPLAATDPKEMDRGLASLGPDKPLYAIASVNVGSAETTFNMHKFLQETGLAAADVARDGEIGILSGMLVENFMGMSAQDVALVAAGLKGIDNQTSEEMLKIIGSRSTNDRGVGAMTTQTPVNS